MFMEGDSGVSVPDVSSKQAEMERPVSPPPLHTEEPRENQNATEGESIYLINWKLQLLPDCS